MLELNASDERGIQVVREKVKTFAQASVSLEVIRSLSSSSALSCFPFDPNLSFYLSFSLMTSGYPCPPYKIIILDEADSMTKDAQHALRRTMEKYSKITRFCIICNYVSRIIEPLASRCAKFRFKSLDDKSARSRLELICNKEGVNIPKDGVDTLLKASEGDLRKGWCIRRVLDDVCSL